MQKYFDLKKPSVSDTIELIDYGFDGDFVALTLEASQWGDGVAIDLLPEEVESLVMALNLWLENKFNKEVEDNG